MTEWPATFLRGANAHPQLARLVHRARCAATNRKAHLATPICVAIGRRGALLLAAVRLSPASLRQSRRLTTSMAARPTLEFQWSYIVGIFSNDNYGQMGMERLQALAVEHRICVSAVTSVNILGQLDQDGLEIFLRLLQLSTVPHTQQHLLQGSASLGTGQLEQTGQAGETTGSSAHSALDTAGLQAQDRPMLLLQSQASPALTPPTAPPPCLAGRVSLQPTTSTGATTSLSSNTTASPILTTNNNTNNITATINNNYNSSSKVTTPTTYNSNNNKPSLSTSTSCCSCPQSHTRSNISCRGQHHWALVNSSRLVKQGRSVVAPPTPLWTPRGCRPRTDPCCSYSRR
ncbi:hypothetical protein EGW08_013055 [Elysia chlorotica]|uniref:Receptor ligand binding region domain-containing protein n=1 Tax=Elysia chlorotica TaxID=188477 RepID=A0A3S0ZZT9_ELYCH|nr:hypothetical protein EGW08_013055 [Elysia chlorotica]